MPMTMKVWDKRATLAEKVGVTGAGLIGTIPVTFRQGNDTVTTMALQDQPLSEVAAQCGQYVQYKCKKGECGTCEVRVDGNWIRTCVTKVPYVPEGQAFEVFVRESMVSSEAASSFFSVKSFISGFRNNALGVYGLVKEGLKGKRYFEERMTVEQEIMEKVKARKEARLAETQG